MRQTRIVIFAKAPVAGKVKTRLIPALGEADAARLAEEMLRGTLREAEATGLGVELCASPHPGSPEWQPFLPTIPATDQGEGGLGERLARAAARVIGSGENILLIGADCPDLDSARLRAASERLQTHDAVIHPAQDGGYVLLGLSRQDSSLFDGIAWSTSSVAADTIARIEALGWSLHVGETLSDIDEPGDLAHVNARGQSSALC